MKKFLPYVIGVAVVLALGFAFWWFGFDHSSKATSAQPLALRDQEWKKGSTNGPVTLIEYADFQCPACGAYYPIVKQLSEEYKDKVTVVFRHFPLIAIHKNAIPAAKAAEAAGKQGKFWEMHNLLFEKQKDWSDAGNTEGLFTEYADSIGLNTDQFKTDLKDKALEDRINADRNSGLVVGVSGTPTFFLQGEKISNPQGLEDFKTLIEAAIIKNPLPVSSAQAKVHKHANFAVSLTGKTVDFSQAKYQSPEGKELDQYAHLHDGVSDVMVLADVLHMHKNGVTLGDFFKSLKMDFTNQCFTLDTGEKSCTQGNNTLKMYVNGQSVAVNPAYEPNDLDRILLSFGSQNDASIQQQISGVADTACIYSEKCPERGKPPTESCVGGLGTDCTEPSPSPKQ